MEIIIDRLECKLVLNFKNEFFSALLNEHLHVCPELSVFHDAKGVLK